VNDLSNYTLEIYNESQRVYIGSIQGLNASNQNKTATVTLKSEIQRKLEKGLAFASAEESNPATMVKNICSQYEIEIDATSFSNASAIYNESGIEISALFKGTGSVFDGIQQILEIGVARVYMQENKLYFDVYRDYDTPPIFYASDKTDNADGITLSSHPIVQKIEKQPLSGYNIKHVDLLGESIFGSTNEQGKTIDGSYSSNVRIMTAATAVWIGERWLGYSNKPQQRINYSIPARFGTSMKINYANGIEYRGREVTVDIVSINNTDKLSSKIGGVTR
jgi:hypothetical protein